MDRELRPVGCLSLVRSLPIILTMISSLTDPLSAKDPMRREQYILVNLSDRASMSAEGFAEIRKALPRVGIAAIFSYLHHSRAETTKDLRRFLDLAQDMDTPVLVQLDGENWWDPSRPGYDPANSNNVEWTGWGPEHAIKIAWRNWGRQIRVLPPPNLMSPRYREACHEELRALVPIILNWWQSLPEAKRRLLVGIKVGWESSIGVNAWYYPNGNDLVNRPASEDPTYGLKSKELPGRGVAPIGYAAVSTVGLRRQGELTESDLVEVVRRHLADLCGELARLGVPREKLFTHTAGWKEGELLYRAAVNSDSCPGWSFYRHAGDPGKDIGVQEALKSSDAPLWAAVEWLYQGPRNVDSWRRALETTLADRRCRFLCIYNWEGIRASEAVLEAIRQVVAAGVDSRQAGE